MANILLQIRLLLWKRYSESIKSKYDLAKLFVPSILFFTLLILLYNLFGPSLFTPGLVEQYLVPLSFWVFVQRIVVQIMFEKNSRLQESMRMMGLSDIAYWSSYFISEGVITGFLLSFLCTIFTVGGLFNNANFGTILGLLFIFCLSAVPFAFFVCAFFDTPQTSGQATLALLLGHYCIDYSPKYFVSSFLNFVAFYVIYIAVYIASVSTLSIPFRQAQIAGCFFPPLGLQIGCAAFTPSYDGISIQSICGILFADIFIYSALAWYFAQVWPSKLGVPKPFYFIVQQSYWFPTTASTAVAIASPLEDKLNEESGAIAAEETAGMEVKKLPGGFVPVEVINEHLVGAPTVKINKLQKTFGNYRAVNGLSFSMYENQIFALLGHNGAGKTTAINMLTGLTNPDYSAVDCAATIYGHNLLTDVDQIRQSLGVCPQHDVLFERLSVREHILFFAQLKGASYESALRDADEYTRLFHLEGRADHLGSELSGGQKRKLSVAISVCGGSKFVVLDEPTAGMDPLARRELWDLLSQLRKGRTILLTTHYMDEADILGDRVGIMTAGTMQCLGSPQFLKSTFGSGYNLVVDKDTTMTDQNAADLLSFLRDYIPTAKAAQEDGVENELIYSLPFDSIPYFGRLFAALEKNYHEFNVAHFGLTISSLEDVFLKVGEDHTVTPKHTDGKGIGSNRYVKNFTSQVVGIITRKLQYASNDFSTLTLVFFPVAVAIAAAILNSLQVISTLAEVNDLLLDGLYVAAYLGAPGLIAELIVREREEKLRNILTVMGCDFRAYWLGTFIADYLLMLIPTVVMWITWGAGNIPDYYNSSHGLCFFITLLFNAQMIAFAYFCSYFFTTSKSAVSLFPILIIVLLILPNILILIGIRIAIAVNVTVSTAVQFGALLWGIVLLSPHGSLLVIFLTVVNDYSFIIDNGPSTGACIAIMIVETALMLGYSYYADTLTVAVLPSVQDETFDELSLTRLDAAVIAERTDTLDNGGASRADVPLSIQRLRKVFPPKVAGRRAVVAVEDVAFKVESGEIFGLLGANGAGKTTVLSMLMRMLNPTAGDAFISNHSILSDFSKGSTHLGVVTQNNSLWDRLTVEAHLLLFARIRGVPENEVKGMVATTIDQLELTPHKHKLAMSLSGGMKRKLCVAIALIGDPEVVLLDEPSAGLDPVSRRNLWTVILRTMSQRAVVLTTHSMEEAEALCRRIGIMVKGQVRVLGTKQRIKAKYGSGFELVVKLHVVDMAKQTAQLTNFVVGLFPNATLISENGGLFTFNIPKDDMKMSELFTNFEEHKKSLSVLDYSVTQPSLEQVFIRTVKQYDAEEASLVAVPAAGGVHDQVVVELNRCGCSKFFMRIFTSVACFLFIVLVGISIGVRAATAAGAIAVIFLITTVVGCIIMFCPCCQPPRDIDQQ